jgi:hypothetical protein
MNGLEKQIAAAIGACEKASASPQASGYLPSVIRSLKAMDEVVRKNGESGTTARRRAAGLFRIVSDDEKLLTSALGKQLVSVINVYRDAMKERPNLSKHHAITVRQAASTVFHGQRMGAITITGPAQKKRLLSARKSASKAARHAS